MPGDRFSASEDEKLIELVAEHPILWNMGLSEFKNQLKKDLIWTEIGRIIKRTSAESKQRWKSIRDHFKKQRKQEKGASTGSAATKKRASYWDRLRFLNCVEDERETVTNITAEIPVFVVGDTSDIEDCTSENNSSFAANATSEMNSSLAAESADKSEEQPPRKSKSKNNYQELLKARREDREHLSKYLEKIVEPEDETDLFFKSMALTVKKFRPDLANRSKKDILNLVMDLEAVNRKDSAGNAVAVKYDSSSCSSSPVFFYIASEVNKEHSWDDSISDSARSTPLCNSN